MSKTEKPKIPGISKKRVRDWFRDCPYWDRLSESEQRWLIENYVPYLNNADKDQNQDPEDKKDREKANKAYYSDLANFGVRSPECQLDAPDKPVLEQRRKSLQTEPYKVRWHRLFSELDWLSLVRAASRSDLEDRIVDAIDAKREDEVG